MFKALGTLLQRATKVCSYLVTGVTGSNNAIRWTAVTEGTAGDNVSITIVNPGTTHTLSAVVAGTHITITLGYATGAITSTAAQVIAFIQATGECDNIVTATNSSTSTGVGVMAAVTETHLASGSNTETFATIAEVNNISGPSMSINTIETTSHDSTGGWKEYVLGVKDGGEVSFNINFLPTNVTQNVILGMVKDYKHGTLRSMKIIWTDADTGALTPHAATEWTFSAAVTKFNPSEPVDGKLGADVTMKISSTITIP